MTLSKAYTFAILTNKMKCVDHNWRTNLIIGYFSLHQMESIFVQRNERNDDAIFQGILVS